LKVESEIPSFSTLNSQLPTENSSSPVPDPPRILETEAKSRGTKPHPNGSPPLDQMPENLEDVMIQSILRMLSLNAILTIQFHQYGSSLFQNREHSLHLIRHLYEMSQMSEFVAGHLVQIHGVDQSILTPEQN
jgi:hypothetical protein